MLVCHCHAVTDHEIRDCVRAGARSAAAVGSACGAGTACGGCRELVEYVVDTEAHEPGKSLVTLRRGESRADAG